MSKGVKLGFAILFLLVIVSTGAFIFTYNEKVSLEKTKAQLEADITQRKDQEQKLSQENKRLDEQLRDYKNRESRLQKQLDDLNGQVTQLTVERNDWKNQVEDLRRERDNLMAKLQEKTSAQPPADEPPSQSSTAAAGQDRYWAGVLKEKAKLELQIKELQDELSSSAIEVEEFRKKNNDLGLELGQLNNEKDELERKYRRNDELTTAISIQLAQEKNDKWYVLDKLEKYDDVNRDLGSRIKGLASTKVSLEKSLVKLKKDKESMGQKLTEAEALIQNRIHEVMDIKKNLDEKMKASGISASSGSSSQVTQVELPPIIVSANGSSPDEYDNAALDAPARSSLEGRVVSINQENNFVIVDLGESTGIRVGDRLSVFRDSNHIADLEVIQVRKDISAADIKQKTSEIRIGDIIR